LYLVKWANETNDLEITWEPMENLKNCKELVDDFDSKQRYLQTYQRLKSDSQNKKRQLDDVENFSNLEKID